MRHVYTHVVFGHVLDATPFEEAKVPTKATFLLFWLILMKPPQPVIRLAKRLALMLPVPSHSANPRHAQSRPPPSMKSNWLGC